MAKVKGCIDADGHVVEADRELLDFLPGKFKGRQDLLSFPFFPTLDGFHRQARRVIDGKGRFIAKGSLQEWQEFLDEDEIAWSVLYPTTGLTFGLVHDKDWASEHLKSGRIFIHCELEERGIAQIAELLRDDILFCASDFPHEPRTEFRENIERFMARADVSPVIKHKLCFENPKRMYPLALL